MTRRPKTFRDFAAQLSALADEMRTQVVPIGPMAPDLVSVARTLVAIRRAREKTFGPDLFAEPAWDILLGLFIAKEEGRSLAVVNVAELSPIPYTTSFRHVDRLEEAGLVRRVPCPTNRRSRLIELTPAGERGMAKLLAMAAGDNSGSEGRLDDRS